MSSKGFSMEQLHARKLKIEFLQEKYICLGQSKVNSYFVLLALQILKEFANKKKKIIYCIEVCNSLMFLSNLFFPLAMTSAVQSLLVSHQGQTFPDFQWC